MCFTKFLIKHLFICIQCLYFKVFENEQYSLHLLLPNDKIDICVYFNKPPHSFFFKSIKMKKTLEINEITDDIFRLKGNVKDIQDVLRLQNIHEIVDRNDMRGAGTYF